MAILAPARSSRRVKRYTPQEFLDLEDGVAFELNEDGTLEERCMGQESGNSAAAASKLLGIYADVSHRGYVIDSGTGLQLFPSRPRRIPRADAGFISADRLPGRRPMKGHLTIAPELLVEVLSPGDHAVDVERKVREYLGAGVELVWVANPELYTVTIWRRDGTVSALTIDDELSGEDAVPGFTCRVRQLFPWLEIAGE
jgi:Uma2 family endonuclease